MRDFAARRGVSIDIVVFDESTHTAQEAAAAIGAELGQIVKSLVFVSPGPRRDRAASFEDGASDGVPTPEDDALDAVIALVSGTDRVDIGRLSEAASRSNLRRASASEAALATGFVIGGIPPFAHQRPLPVIMDPRLTAYAEVWAAAGTPNAVFRLDPRTLAALSDAVIAPCARTPPMEHP